MREELFAADRRCRRALDPLDGTFEVVPEVGVVQGSLRCFPRAVERALPVQFLGCEFVVACCHGGSLGRPVGDPGIPRNRGGIAYEEY